MPALFQTHQIQGTAGTGPKLLITGGVHGDEYEGIEAIRKLIDTIDPRKLRGQLMLVPVVNESAYESKARTGEDGLDLARTCPGKEDGTLTERVAYELSQLIGKADFYIDLHSGGNIMQVDPLVGYSLVSDSSILDTQRRMARAFGLPIIWGTSAELEGRSLSVARDAKVPAIYAEYLGAGNCSEVGFEAYVEGCLNVMAELGMMDKRVPVHAPEIVIEDPRSQSGHMQICHPSPAEGTFKSCVQLGQVVEEGQSMGVVTNQETFTSQTIQADHAGRVIVLRTATEVKEGDSLAVILESQVL